MPETKLTCGNCFSREDFILSEKDLKIIEYQFGSVKSEQIFRLDEISLRREITHTPTPDGLFCTFCGGSFNCFLFDK